MCAWADTPTPSTWRNAPWPPCRFPRTAGSVPINWSVLRRLPRGPCTRSGLENHPPTAGDARWGRDVHRAPQARSGLGSAARRSEVPGAIEEIFRRAADGGNERSFAVTEFIARLKQRKLVQWALAYVAAAWALLQALGLAVDSYDWPHGV